MSSGDEYSINAAIKAAYNNGTSVVQLSARTYTLKNPIIPRSGITLAGAGIGNTIITVANNIALDTGSDFYLASAYRCPGHYPAPYGPMVGIINGTNANNVKFHDFSIDGNADSMPTCCRGKGHFNCIQLNQSDNVEVYNVHCYNSLGDGIRVYGAGSKAYWGYNINIHNCKCENLGHDAFYALRCVNVYIHDNYAIARTNACARFQDVQYGYIYNNDFTAYSNLDSGPGIEIGREKSSPVAPPVNVEIYNNRIHETWGPGIHIVNIGSGTGSSSSIGAKVHHNLFYNCGNQHGNIDYTAGVVTGGIHNINIENNVFIGNKGGGVAIMTYSRSTSYSGILINVKNNIFLHNRLRTGFKNSGWGVINYLGSSHTVDVAYNCFYNNASGTATGVHKFEGNFSGDPQLAAASLTTGVYNQDCHLKSVYGRYHNGTWVKDGAQSPCIDRGDPSFGYGKEPEDNGNRIDIGMYGNTLEASLSGAAVAPRKPKTSFSYSPAVGMVPLTVYFTDKSDYYPTKWKWDFGYGVTSTSQNPIITYNGVGTYSVTLTTTNSAGSDSTTLTNCIIVKSSDEPIQPTVGFIGRPRHGKEPLTVDFTDQSDNFPTSWLWKFGDGISSTAHNPSHIYTEGTYSVSLTASNSAGSDGIIKSDYIKVTDGTPVADFTATPVAGNAPLTVQFTDDSANDPTTWLWKFGDGDSSTRKNPSHKYTLSGVYNVTLTVKNSYGSDIEVKNKLITVRDINPFTGVSYDNRLRKIAPNVVYSKTSYLDIGGDNSISRSLLWFNLDDYKNTTIKSAKLCLYWYSPDNARDNDTVVEIYRPAELWDPAAVSWNYRLTERPWTHNGGYWCDKNGEARGDVPYDAVTFYSSLPATEIYYEFDVTQLVNEYVNGIHPNYGFLLKAKLESDNYVKFYSSECGSSLTAPKLILKYNEVIPIATKLYVAGDGTGTFNCDGNDDDIQINQALKLAKENPNLYSGVYLKGEFIYNISKPIFVSGILEGDSTATVRLINNADWAVNTAMFQQYKTGLTSVVIRGFKIDGNRANNTAVLSGKGYYNLISITDCSNIDVHDMNLVGGHNHGLIVSNCESVQYYNNTVYLLGYDGLYTINSSHVNSYNNTITCRTNSGIHIYNTDYVHIYDNNILSEGSGGAGILIEKYGTPAMADIEIYSNRIHDTRLAGILCIGSSSYGSPTAVCNIHNNVIYNTGSKNTRDQAGGIVTNGWNCIIDNNTIDGCYRSGVGIRETDDSASITGTVTVIIRSNNITNTLEDSDTNNGYGIDYTPLANHSIVQQNNCLYQNAGGNYHNVTAPTGSVANITSDPLYVDRTSFNYYLKSKAGRWDIITHHWTVDDVKSPCIDAGYAESDCSEEPDPNSEIVNIGAYGNTAYASYSGDVRVVTNHAPVIPTIPNKIIEIAHQLTFNVGATDADGDTLTYTMDPIPTGATLGLYTGIFDWTPVTNQDGTYPITFSVSDGLVTTTQVVTIGVIKQEIITLLAGEIIVNSLSEHSPTTVYNKLSHVDIGARNISDTNYAYRSLIMIDLSEYTGKTITSAILSMYWYYPDGAERVNNTVVEIYRPLAWNTNYATWSNKNSSTAWVTPGGDWLDSNGALNGTVPYASVSFGNDTVPDNAYHNFDLTTLIQRYVAGTLTNTGILLKAHVEDDNFISFYSQRFLTGAQLKLTVLYTE